MKVFLGTYDVAKILTGYKEGFKSIGCEVTTLIKSGHPFFKQQQYDHAIFRKFPNSGSIKNNYVKKAVEYVDFNIQDLRIRKKLDRFIEEHDIFIFIWQSLLKDRSDLQLIKAANKKIVSVFVGSEVRHISAFRQEFGGDQSTWEKGFHEDDLNSRISTLRSAELYSDLILSVPDQAGLAIRPYNHTYIPLDASKIEFKLVDNRPLKIIHAPSKVGAKGTALITSTIERLQKEGVEMEFKLLLNISNSQLMEELKNADILVDELYLHGPGMLSLEGMASGCAVATHTMSDYKDIFDPPVCNITDKNIYEQLKFLFTNRDYRLKLIKDGKKFVDEKNNPATLAQQIVDTLNSPTPTYDYTPRFFIDKYQLPANELINNENLELTKNVLSKFNISKQQDIIRAKKEKLIL